MKLSATKLNRFVDLLREVVDEASVLWWRFFDWVALVEWRQLAIIAFITFTFGLMLGFHVQAFWFIFLAVGVKVLAGGKRKAELQAKEAHYEADVATLERRLMEAQMAALQAQVEPHFLFNTLAL
ncbi:MAG: histidine kinase, partial [Burkholderiaceae bacterium]